MKEIGQKLKDKREENGVSVEEVAEDLKMRPSQIEAIESGDKSRFDDSFVLKDFILEYSKYLGLDSEKILDEFNEYMFDVKSKISLEDIENAKKEDEEAKKVVSPYTKISNDNSKKKIIIGIIAFIIIVIGIVFVVNFTNKDLEKDNITYAIGR